MQELQNQINESLYTIVQLLLTLGTLYAIIYLNKAINKAKIEANKISDERQRALINNTLENLRTIIAKNIVAVEETSKQILIETKGKNLTREDLSILASEVLEKTKKQIGTDAIDLLSNTYGDIDSYIKTELENQLKYMKLQNKNIVSEDEYNEALKQIEELKKQLNHTVINK